MECRLTQIVEVSTRPRGGSLIIGEVVRFHVDDAIVDNFRIDPDQLRAVGRMGGNEYTRTRDRFQMIRPEAQAVVARREVKSRLVSWIWEPSKEQIEATNVWQFMRGSGCGNREEFLRYSTDHLEEFWARLMAGDGQSNGSIPTNRCSTNPAASSGRAGSPAAS